MTKDGTERIDVEAPDNSKERWRFLLLFVLWGAAGSIFMAIAKHFEFVGFWVKFDGRV